MSGFSGRSRRRRGGRVFGAALFGGAVLLAACSGPQAVLQQASSQVSAASVAPAPEGDAQPGSSGADLPSGAGLTGVPSRSPSDAASASAASGAPAGDATAPNDDDVVDAEIVDEGEQA